MTSADALSAITAACATGKLTESAADNIRKWLTEDRYAEYANQVIDHIAGQKWRKLDDVFWTVIPFGTGGRRGKMYPFGSNAINDRTIGESAQGLADYVKSIPKSSSTTHDPRPTAHYSCAIAYDTRHRSTHFARLCAEIMVAAGFKVYFLDGHRSTPELSFTVRQKQCDCGIMVTASHNPPSDNAVKVYWSTGGQILPPYDKVIIECVMHVDTIERTPWDNAVAAGNVVFCQDEMDAAFIDAVLEQALPGPRALKIVYSPLHGVGATAVCPALERDGFKDVEVFAPHAEPNGDFPNVPGHVSNPENPAVFDAIIERAQETGADLTLATDPDCDRIGCAAPLTGAVGSGQWVVGSHKQLAVQMGVGGSGTEETNEVRSDALSAKTDVSSTTDCPLPTAHSTEWHTITGNQIGALLADFILEGWKEAGKLTPEHFVVETLVTTQLIRRIADSYGVRTESDLLVGFKWIAGVIDRDGPETFIFGAEESHGYLAGQHVRDKDGAVAAMLLCELAAKLKADGKTLHEKLDDLFRQHGGHAERTVSVQMPGSQGMANMRALMAGMREDPPRELAGFQVARVRDYLSQTQKRWAAGSRQWADAEPLTGPKGDLVMLGLACDGNYAAVRPSGTEPKVKFYLFAYKRPEQIANLDDAKAKLEERLTAMERDLRKCAGA